MRLTPKRYITVDQLRVKLDGHSLSSIFHDLEYSCLPNTVRIGKRLCWDEDEIDAFLSTRKAGARR